MSSKFPNSFASKYIQNLYLQSELADVHFVFPSMELAPPEKVPAHKILLASASPVFSEMFYGPSKEGDTIEIAGSNATAFKELLQFIYLPEVTLTIGNIEEVFDLADKYDMLECIEMCAKILAANSAAILCGYELAIKLKNAQLIEFCENHIRKNTTKILRSEMFLDCSREVIGQILDLDALECDEFELFNACIDWAKASCQKNSLDINNSENLKEQLGACFYSIRFGAMPREDISKLLSNETAESIFARDELLELMQYMCTKQFKSKLFDQRPRFKTTLVWDAANKLVCKRNILMDSVQPIVAIQKEESTWFTTNEVLLLGEVYFVPLQALNRDFGLYVNVTVDSDIDIIEYDANDFVANAAFAKKLYAISNFENISPLLLPTPITIRPNKIYEIRLQPKFGVGNYSHNSTWDPDSTKVKLNERITIQFHANPSGTNELRRGLVSSLSFNQIN